MPNPCHSCGRDQTVPPSGAHYEHCFECGHVWNTETEFVEHWRSTWEGIPNLPEYVRADLEKVTADQVFACPCCSHDL